MSSITMPSLVGLGFHPLPGRQKMSFFVCPSQFVVRHAYFVRHAFSVRQAFERQSLFARFRHEGVGVQK